MKNYPLPLAFIIGLFWFTGCSAQQSGTQLLTLQKEIILPGVSGRIDHIDIDIKDQVAFVAVLGNNTLEIADLKTGKVTGTISGLDEPQGVAYIARHSEILAANGGTGECVFYDAATLKRTGSVKLADDADDVRYDEAADKIYVGYGEGGIAVIDAAKHDLEGNIPLPAHPESFQLDSKSGRIWINLPGSGMIGVADLKQLKMIAEWKHLIPRANFPMAYDQLQHRIIVGYRVPAKLIVYDSETGKELFKAPMTGDADDLYWDAGAKRIYVSGGSGMVNIFEQTGTSGYRQVANIKTRSGARTSLLVPQLSLLLLAARASEGQKAALLVYKTNLP